MVMVFMIWRVTFLNGVRIGIALGTMVNRLRVIQQERGQRGHWAHGKLFGPCGAGLGLAIFVDCA